MDRKPVLLVDLDCTLVDMLTAWLKKYNEATGENVRITDIKEYDMGHACPNNKVLYDILNQRGFFYEMEPMPGAIEALQGLMDDGYDVVIVTQPPRKAEFAVQDKRRWMKKYFGSFSAANMVFCHRKELIEGDLLFDDRPSHLINWKKNNPEGLTATIDWLYNRDVQVDFRGSQKSGWKEFVEFVRKNLH